MKLGMLRLFVAALPAIAPAAATELPIAGPARVVDGDTIVVGREHVRLEGIDAPEKDQSCRRAGKSWPCGTLATSALRSLIRDRPVSCTVVGRDRYGRALGVCTAGGAEVNAGMVRAGFALAFRRYSDRYVPEEDVAKAKRAGMWSGEFVEPWEHRRIARGATPEPVRPPPTTDPISRPTPPSGASAGLEQPAPGCEIKGNVNRNGERIFHLPGMVDYDKVVMTPAKGKRWFCLEQDAIRAGWRRSKR
ncbi:thermonuclease family protein [Rhodoplanes sp. SY1]|uniref:thermonuclease family protein n=1 Tax=Rhodoplanes sp. SY1 TaxID=3166646 RepID=UPI0038B596B1